MVGTSGWGAGRRIGVMPIALALGVAAVGGFMAAHWASGRAATPVTPPPVGGPEAPAAPDGAGAPRPLAPPATYAAPSLPPVAAPSRTEPAGQRVPASPTTEPQAPSRRAAPDATTATPALAPTYALQAVTERDGQPVAIVNGQLVRVGDWLEGGRILSISADAVVIEKDGRRLTLGF